MPEPGDYSVSQDYDSWYALRVRCKAEDAVAKCLTMHGFETLCPLRTRRSQWSDRVKVTKTPVFPSYIFSRFPVDSRNTVLLTPGVKEIVRTGDELVPLTPNEVTSIRFIADNGDSSEPWPYLSEGQRVRVKRGPFAGLEGLMIRAKDRAHVVISLHLLQRSIITEIEEDRLSPI